MNLTDGQRDRLISTLVTFAADGFRDELESVAAGQSDQFESPIELAFHLMWIVATKTGSSENVPPAVPQYEVKVGVRTYRLDFAILRGHRKVAVELDGHDFHERTPEQVESRNQRDADLQAAGWRVLHFSGRQILRNPLGCLDRVLEALWGGVVPEALWPGASPSKGDA